MSVSKVAANRLRKELKAISTDPPPYIHVACDDANILCWNYLLEGPADTPYAGGWYWGRLRFPKEYPLRPPSIMMVTPSGRFETNTRLCLSMSDYHPESWQPVWSLGTVLQGLLSFMCEESPTAGAIHPPPSNEERRKLAGASLEWNKAQADFLKAFPEVDEIVANAVSSSSSSRPPKPPQAVAESGDAAENGVQRPEAPAEISQEAPARDAPAAAQDEQRFAPGDVVRLCGLMARPDLNGQSGVVETACAETAAANRIQVRVAGETIAAKPMCLELVSRGADAAAPQA